MKLEIGKWYELVGTPTSSTSTQTGGVDVMLVSQDTTNNTSLIRIKPWAKKMAGTGAYNLNAQTTTLKADNQTKNAVTKYDLRNQSNNVKLYLTDNYPFKKEGGEGHLLDGAYVFDFAVSHNNDGSKVTSIYGLVALQNNGQGRNWIVDTTVELPTIARASKVACPSFNLGNKPTISIETSPSSFVFTLEFNFPSIKYTGTIEDKTSKTTIVWDNLDYDYILTKIPKDTFIKGTITCKTYTNANTVEPIGTTSCEFTAYVENLGVELKSVDIVDTNDNTFALTGNRGTIVKYISKPKFIIEAEPKQYATIVSYSVTCGNQTIKQATNEIIFENGVEINDFDLSVKDSRGFGTPIIIGCEFENFIDYIKLGIKDFNMFREESTSTKLNIDISGIFFNGNFGVADNELDLQYRYKEKNGEYSEIKHLTLNTSQNTFSLIQALEDVFDFNKQYDFEFVLSDKLMSVVTTIQVEGGESIVRIAEKYVRIAEDLKVEKVLTVGDIQCKNVFDEEYAKNVSNYSKYGTEVSSGYHSIALNLEPNTTYTFSRADDEGYGTGVYCVLKLDGQTNGSLDQAVSKWIIHNDSNDYCNQKIGFTTSSTGIVLFTIAWADTLTQDFVDKVWDVLKHVQIEKGIVATSYSKCKFIGFETKSNENGTYTKFEDGTLMQRGESQCPAGVGYADITFPVPFKDLNYTMICNHKYTGGDGFGGSAQLRNITNPQPYATNKAYIYSYLYDASIASYPRKVCYIAIGKWK